MLGGLTGSALHRRAAMAIGAVGVALPMTARRIRGQAAPENARRWGPARPLAPHRVRR